LWSSVKASFQNRKAGLAVARVMIENGVRLDRSGRFFVGDIEVPDTSIAKAASVDRRAVRETAKFIMSDKSLMSVFGRLRPSGSSLADVAKQLGFSVLKVESDPHSPGVISQVSGVLARHHVVIRQALADDPDLVPEPRLTLVVEGQLSADALDEIRSLKVVKSLMLQN
jgi:predicted regulator of amino acid metabolism with ACT domain